MSDTNGEDSALVVDKANYVEKLTCYAKKNAPACIIVFVLMVVLYVAVYYKDKIESFASPDGVVARRKQNQRRSDPEVDGWSMEEMENAIAAINKAAAK